MQRQRQALGVISNQFTNTLASSNSQNSLKPALPQHPLKSHPSLNSLKGKNDENACFAKKEPSAEFDFEIFQEECEEKFVDKENIGAKVTEAKVAFSCTDNYEDESEYKSELMESSVLNNSNSPMALDDTIKSESFELHNDQDSEVEERENLLVNCNEYKVYTSD